MRNPNPWDSSSNPRATNSTTLKHFLLEIAVVYIEKFLLINKNHIWIYISCIRLIFLVPVKCNMHDIIINLLFYFIYFLLFIKIIFILFLGWFWKYLTHYWIINSLLFFLYKHIQRLHTANMATRCSPIIIFYIAQVRHRGCPDDREWSEIANKCFIFFYNMW